MAIDSRYKTLHIEACEERLNLSGISFLAHNEAIFAERTFMVGVTDVNVDGVEDIVILQGRAGDLTYSWYTVIDDKFVRQNQVGVTQHSGRDAAFGDLDNDGDIDIVFGGKDGVFWLENDGLGDFSSPNIVNTATNIRAFLTAAADFDADGDIYVASLDLIDLDVEQFFELSLYENTDGLGTFGPRVVLESFLTGADDLEVGDVDGDGLTDLLTLSTNLPGESSPSEFFWHLNFEGTFLGIDLAEVVDDEFYTIRDSYLEDIDGDNDLDLVITDLFHLDWSENLDGAGDFGPFATIATGLGNPGDATFLRFADLDADGDRDILRGTLVLSGDYEISWLENMDGMGSFAAPEVLAVTTPVTFLEAADVDGDGDLDIVTAPWQWFESDLINATETLEGDVNSDGEVNFDDFVILSANFGRSDDVSRDDGDLDEDGVIAFSDFLVLANNFGRKLETFLSRITPGPAE